MNGTSAKPLVLILIVATIVLLLVMRSDIQISSGKSSLIPTPEKKPAQFPTAPPVLLQEDKLPRPPASEIFYLFDISRSFHTGSPSSPFSRAVSAFEDVLMGMGKGKFLPLPQRHRVGTIGKLSLRQTARCNLIVEQEKIFLTPQSVTTELEACKETIKKISSEDQTDIRGALMYAALMMKGPTPMPRAVILLTDLKEDIQRGDAPAVPDLSDLCIAVFYEVTEEHAHQPNQQSKQITDWTSRFTEWKAKKTIFELLQKFEPQVLGSFLQKCAYDSPPQE